MEYLRYFDNHNQYIDFKDGSSYKTPNISRCLDDVHTHYNPKELLVSGKFTVPSRLSTESSPYTGGTKMQSEVVYGDGTELLLSNVRTITGGEAPDTAYTYISVGIEFIAVDESGNTFAEIGHKEVDGVKYYYPSRLEQYVIRVDSQSGVTFGSFAWDDTNGVNIFVPMNGFFKTELVRENVVEIEQGTYREICVTKNINKIKCTYNSESYKAIPIDDSSNMYTGTFTYAVNNKMLILPLDGGLNIPLYENKSIVKDLFSSIEIDGEKIDLDDLIESDGWYILENGVHSILYRVNKGYVHNGYLPAGLFMHVPIEELQLDSKIKGTVYSISSIGYNTQVFTAFEGCALLGTDEETIARACTYPGTSLNGEVIAVPPLVIECEFEDDDNYLNRHSSGRLSSLTHYAVHNGVAGLIGYLYIPESK